MIQNLGVNSGKIVSEKLRIPDIMADYASDLAKFLKISKNDAYKMMLFEYMQKHKRN